MSATKLISVRRNSVEALGNLGAAAKSAVPGLLKMLANDDEITRINAAVALWKIDHHPKALPTLLEMLRHGTPPEPYEAAMALGRMDADPAAVAPALLDVLAAEDADVRRAAAWSLGHLGRPALPLLADKKGLAASNAEVRAWPSRRWPGWAPTPCRRW